MKKDKNSLSRRNLLKGLGALGILPWCKIEPLLAQNTNAPLRVLVIATQHGWGIGNRSNREMSSSGTDFSFPAGLEPLNSIKQHCNVIDGIFGPGLWGNNHDLSYADILTAGVFLDEEESSFNSHFPLPAGPSIDYLLEQASGKEAFRFSANYRSWGESYHPLSFSNNGTVLPQMTTAFKAWERFFANLPSDNSNPVDGQLSNFHQRLFSFLKGSAQARLTQLTSDNKVQLERYISSLDALKTSKTPVTDYNGTATLDRIPTYKNNLTNQDYYEMVDDYLDMIRVGFTNALTNVAVLGIGDIWDHSGFHESHAHQLSNTYWDTRSLLAQKVTNFVNRLTATQDIDGSPLLDNTIIVLTGEVGHGIHDVLRRGTVVIGGKNKMQTNRLIKTPTLYTGPSDGVIKREKRDGSLGNAMQFGSRHHVSLRTNADLYREIGNMAGLNLSQFGLPSLNKGDILI